MPPKTEKRSSAGSWILLCILCLGVGAGLGMAGLHLYNRGDIDRSSTDLDRPSDEPRDVVALGRIEPKEGTLSVGVPTPDRLAKLKVKEGDVVKKGDLLAVLDSEVLREQERKVALVQREHAEQRTNAIKASGEASIRVEEIKGQQLDQLEPIELQSLDSKIDFLKKQEENAVKDYDRYVNAGDIVAAQDREKQRLLLNQVRAEMIAARCQREKLVKTHELNRELANAQLKAAREELNLKLSAISRNLLDQQIAQAEQRVKDARIEAPSNGRILRLHVREGELVGGRPILEMANTDKMIVVTEVVDTDVHRVRVGQKATITRLGIFEGDKKLTGKVVSIGSNVGRAHVFDVDPRAAMDNRVVEVKVELDDGKPVAELIGLQVTVTIAPNSVKGSH